MMVSNDFLPFYYSINNNLYIIVNYRFFLDTENERYFTSNINPLIYLLFKISFNYLRNLLHYILLL